MPNYNQVILMGNVTRDPVFKQLPQTTVAEFGLATSRKFRTAEGEDREEVCYLDCVAYGKQAEVLHQYLAKGKPLFVQGRLRYDTWEDKQGGGKRSRIWVVVENFQFIGARDGSGSYPGAAAEQDKQDKRERPGETQKERHFEREDIPF